MDREACGATFHGVAKSQTWLSDWNELNWTNVIWLVFFKKRILGHRLVKREDHVKIQGENGHLKANDRGLQRNHSLQIFWSYTYSFQNAEKINFSFNSVCLLCYSSPQQMNIVSVIFSICSSPKCWHSPKFNSYLSLHAYLCQYHIPPYICYINENDP